MRSQDIAVVAGIATFLLLDAGGGLAGEKVQVRWNGNYPHNDERTFSADYQLGWSKNFMNGFPEENGVVQRDGFLPAEVVKPKGPGPFRFVVLMQWMRRNGQRRNEVGRDVLLVGRSSDTSRVIGGRAGSSRNSRPLAGSMVPSSGRERLVNVWTITR